MLYDFLKIEKKILSFFKPKKHQEAENTQPVDMDLIDSIEDTVGDDYDYGAYDIADDDDDDDCDSYISNEDNPSEETSTDDDDNEYAFHQSKNILR